MIIEIIKGLLVAVILCFPIIELGVLLALFVVNKFNVPLKDLQESDFINCELSVLMSKDFIFFEKNGYYNFTTSLPLSSIVKYYIKTNNEKWIPVFIFSKNYKIIKNKFKELNTCI